MRRFLFVWVQNLNPFRSRVPPLHLGRRRALQDSTPDLRQRSAYSRSESTVPRSSPSRVPGTPQVRQPLRLADMGRDRHAKTKPRERPPRPFQVRGSSCNEWTRHGWDFVCEHPWYVSHFPVNNPVISGGRVAPLIAVSSLVPDRLFSRMANSRLGRIAVWQDPCSSLRELWT